MEFVIPVGRLCWDEADLVHSWLVSSVQVLGAELMHHEIRLPLLLVELL